MAFTKTETDTTGRASMTHILFVCTANICRSPMAQALLQVRAGAHAREVAVASAGLLERGQPAAPGTLRLLEQIRIDGRSHLSRTLNPELIRRADLVLGMERRHVQEVALLAPDAFPRAFTLKELVRRGNAMGPRQQETLEQWVTRANAGRTPRDLLGADPDDDIADPYGGDEHEYERTFRELDRLVSRLVDLLWPSWP
jgi:protein-tyrosine phosphatase